MSLEQELATYQRELPGLLEQEGSFVLIHGRDVGGVFPSQQEAMDGGYSLYGPGEPFLVKQIQAVDKPVFVAFKVFPDCRTRPIPS